MNIYFGKWLQVLVYCIELGLGRYSLLTLHYPSIHTNLRQANLSQNNTNSTNLNNVRVNKNMQVIVLIKKHALSTLKNFSTHRQGWHHVNFFGRGELCKSWTSYPGQYSDLSEGATKAKLLKVNSLIM